MASDVTLDHDIVPIYEQSWRDDAKVRNDCVQVRYDGILRSFLNDILLDVRYKKVQQTR